MGERKTTLIILLILSITVVSTSEMEMVQSESSSEVTLNDEYVVNFVMGGFGGNVSVCSFNASKGYWIELELSSSSSDSFKVFLDILSANHGIIFSATGKNFSQTVYLDYDDTYTITISKSPFYSSVRVRGTISVFHQETSGQPSSGNWVEVTRFSGDRIGISRTEYFSCEHVEWRIKWEYVPNFNSNWSTLNIYVNDLNRRLDSVVNTGSEITNGTLYINDDYGTYFLDLISNVPNYLIIIEQNIESIPEFPSWAILPIVLTATLAVAIYRKRMNRLRVKF